MYTHKKMNEGWWVFVDIYIYCSSVVKPKVSHPNDKHNWYSYTISTTQLSFCLYVQLLILFLNINKKGNFSKLKLPPEVKICIFILESIYCTIYIYNTTAELKKDVVSSKKTKLGSIMCLDKNCSNYVNLDFVCLVYRFLVIEQN